MKIDKQRIYDKPYSWVFSTERHNRPYAFLRYCFLLAFLYLPIQKGLAQDLSLLEAKKLLLENNGRYESARLNTEKASEQKKEKKGLRYPSLDISGTYLHLQNDISIDLNTQRDMAAGLLEVEDPTALGDWSGVLQVQDFAFASANITWPLFTGGRINAANKAAGIQLDLANDQKYKQENELTIQLINAYYGVKLTHELVKLRQEVLDLVKLHKNRADKFFENGIIAEVETLNAEVALSQAERDLSMAEKDKNLAETALKNIINFENFDNLSTSFKIPEVLTPLEVYEEKMIKDNVQMALLDKTAELAETGLKAEKSAYLPSLAAIGNYQFFNENFALGQLDWYVGLGLEWNLFDGFQREHKINAAKLSQSQVSAMKSQVKMDLLTYTQKLYGSMEKQFKAYQSLEKEEKLAKKLKYMRDRAFEQGLGTSLEVLDATVKLSQIQFLKLQTLYEFSKTKGELMVQIGETEEFLTK